MCPTGLCFTPHLSIKKSIDSFGESQAAQALGIEIDLAKKTSSLWATPSALIRLSPIAYFYARHSPAKRLEVLADCAQRMFGSHTSVDVFSAYIEFLVATLNGNSKDELLQSVQLTRNPSDPLNTVFFELLHLISSDGNSIDQGIQLAKGEQRLQEDECHYLNPLNSDATILLTLYLQVCAPLYRCLPRSLPEHVYGKSTIECLTQWVAYQRKSNLRQV